MNALVRHVIGLTSTIAMTYASCILLDSLMGDKAIFVALPLAFAIGLVFREASRP